MATTSHGALTANTVKQIELESGRGGIVVVNRTQEGIIWVRIDGQDPVPEGAGTYAVFGAREFPLTRNQQNYPIDVRMITDEDRAYTVEAF
jgi:hypothetical protein